MSLFGVLGIGTRGLAAAQAELSTAGHNVANAATAGYSRQRVNLAASPAQRIPVAGGIGLGMLGTGVDVTSVSRVRDGFLDLAYRQQAATQGGWSARSDELGKVESIFPEPSPSGLGTTLSRFWNAWSDLADAPTSVAARTAVAVAAQTLSARVNRDAGQLETATSDVNARIGIDVAKVNDFATRVATLNGLIAQAGPDAANDLADQRDQLIDQIATLVPVTADPQADGSVRLLVGGVDLVTAGIPRAMSAVDDGSGNLTPTWTDGGMPVTLGQAELGALVSFRDTELAGYRADLDTLARTVADAVNAAHATGVDATGQPGGTFLTYDPTRPARSLALDPVIAADPQRIAAAASAGAQGDGSVADTIAALRSAKLFGAGTQTASDFYAGLVSRIGIDTQQASEMADNQQIVMDHLTARREETSGVSLDEEAAAMIRFQHAYEAAARVISAADEMLDVLINKTGLVGR